MATTTNGIIVRINDTDIGRLESIGDIKIGRGTKEYAALNRDDVIIAIGRAQSVDLPVGVLMDQADTGAQKALRDAIRNAAPVKFEIEFPDGQDSGTKLTWSGAVVTEESMKPDEDGFVISTFTVKLPGFPNVTGAS